MEHNIVTEFADVFECSCGYKYEGPNRSAVENAHLYVNHFIGGESPLASIAESLAEIAKTCRHLDNGEVYLKADVEHLQDYQVLKGYRITITEGDK